MANYAPFRTDANGELLDNLTGSTIACRHCGVKPANQHSLREAGQCDWQKKSPAEKATILAARAAKEVAA